MAQEAHRQTTSVPIVMSSVRDPVEAGLVASLARPGGNMTGPVADTGPEIAGKKLAVLKEAFRKLLVSPSWSRGSAGREPGDRLNVPLPRHCA